jgi:hypothetical protein
MGSESYPLVPPGGGGGGDTVGPASSTDNAIARFDGTTGKLLQNSSATISDSGLLTATSARVTSLNTGDHLIKTDTDGDLVESGFVEEAAPTGGSGIKVVEYASAPVSPPTGFVWIQAVDANTQKLCYYDGTSTYSVELTT